jgi:hypothetical protein
LLGIIIGLAGVILRRRLSSQTIQRSKEWYKLLFFNRGS